jgi:hypothetical protein
VSAAPAFFTAASSLAPAQEFDETIEPAYTTIAAQNAFATLSMRISFPYRSAHDT